MDCRRWFARCVVAWFLTFAGCSELHEAEPDTPLGLLEQAATLPSGFVDELVVSGLSSPTTFAFAPDSRIFVVQQAGRIRVIKNGQLLASDFVRVATSATGERGALGIAFDPNFASNSYVYVYYTALSPTVHNRVSRFRAQGDVAVAGSEQILLELDNLSSATNHNGGALHFGPDGKLYIAVGDNARGSNAPSLTTLHGKILRINPDGSIPSDNPFFGATSGKYRAIWAVGLRNPYTFAFQPGSGRMFINDVGLNRWEEINEGRAGANYGWPSTEGPISADAGAGFVSPLYAYLQSDAGGNGCAITGGVFYNPASAVYPASYVGKYLFADYCAGFVRQLDPAARTASGFASGALSPVDLRLGPDGFVYRLERGATGVSAALYRMRYGQSGQAPTISAQPAAVTAAVGQTVRFGVVASGTAPLSYQWQRNGVNIAGATAASYERVVVAADQGAQFRVIVSNSLGSVTSQSALLTVSSNRPPTVSIARPVEGAGYLGNIDIAFSASASDPEEGVLPASRFSWEIVLHHDEHTHPVLTLQGRREGTFHVPSEGHNQLTAFFRVRVTVRDAQGLTATAFRDVTPIRSSMLLDSVPPGLEVRLEGAPYTTPANPTVIMFMSYTLSVTTPQTLDGRIYDFVGWFGSNPATSIDYVVPANSRIALAVFQERTSGAQNLASSGQIVARVTAPQGEGSRNIEVIRDGVKPAAGSTDPSQQYDTYTGRLSTTDFIGYTFSRPYSFERVLFQEGRQYWYGGWFDSLTLQVLQGGSWIDVPSVTVTPPYARNNGRGYEQFEFAFPAITGSGLRLFGRPGGLADFISVGELEVYGR